MAPRAKDAAAEWAPWFTIVNNMAKCVFCSYQFSYKKGRALKHYKYDAGARRANCPGAPDAVIERFRTCGDVVPRRMTHMEMYGSESSARAATSVPCSSQSVPGGEFIDVEDRSHRTDEERNSNMERSESTPILSREDSCNPRSMRQQGMLEAYQITKRKELDEKWATFFYEANVPFNVARHPSFIAAVDATSRAKFDYKPPTYNAMQTKLIEPKKNQVKLDLELKTKQCISLYGATICSDGWDNVVRRPLMNIMLACPVGDIFLGSIDTTGNPKNKAYIAGKMKEYIRQVGPMNVVQVCSDNASAMLGALDRVVAEYPHLYKQGCAAHIIDLLLEDWGKEETFKDLISMAKRVCIYIRSHHVTMALFRQFSPKLSLLLPAATRFACQFLMISRLLQLKAALTQVVVHAKWDEYVGTLFNRQSGLRAHALACTVRSIVLDTEFWERCENFVHVVEPALVTLRTFDGQTPAMGRAWLAMNNLKKHVYALRDAPFYLPTSIATRFEARFSKRWKMMITDLHYAGALLNPYLTNCVELQSNGVAKRALNRVLTKLSGVLGLDNNVVTNELVQFEERNGPYGPLEAPDIRETRLLPHQWWQRVGGDALPLIAKRILSLTCSASSCERNWSMYSFVHNKVRNRLGVKKAEDLVYIYANSKLLRERRGADPVIWYDNQPFSEDSDLDVDPFDGEDSSIDGGDDGNASGDDDDNDGGDSVDEDFGNDSARELPGANRDDGVFNWSGDDEEPTRNINPPVDDLPNVVNTEYDRADDRTDDELDTNRSVSNDGVDGDDVGDASDDEDNDNHDDGGTSGGVQIPNEGFVETHREDVEQPEEAVQKELEQTSRPRMFVGTEDHGNGHEDDLPIGQLFPTPAAQSSPSVGTLIAQLRRTTTSPSSSPRHPEQNATTAMNRTLNSRAGMAANVGPSNRRRGVKRSALAPTTVRPFVSGYTRGNTSSSPVTMGTRGINEDGVTDRNKRRKVKKIVTTRVDGEIVGQVRNINSTVEELQPNALGDEAEVDGDDEGPSGSEDSRAEVPNDEDVILKTPVEMAGARKNPRRFRKRKG